jgi:glucosamine-6-phosphate deaminase
MRAVALTTGAHLDWSGDDLQPRRVRRPAPDDPGSYRRFMQEHLFRTPTSSPSGSTFLIGHRRSGRGMPALRAAIAEAGGIDMQILGIGTNGHIGFNEPAPASSRARTGSS